MKRITENDITVSLFESHDNPSKCKVFYNPKMKICRELVLCSLGTATASVDFPITCLDAFAATGLAGLQWKKHFGENIQVTINDFNRDAVANILENSKQNKFICIPERGVGNSGPGQDQHSQVNDDTGQEFTALSADNQVEVVNSDAHIILHQRQFHFIHLDPYGTTVQFLDGAFRNIYHKGMMVVTATDIATLYGKFPQVALRNYGATVSMVDYHKEMAVRLLLAAVVRSAAKANKGIEVLHAVCVEHFAQVCVRVQRGTAHADKCVKKLRRVLHCQLCEQWAIYPAASSPLENPYSLLPCKCHIGSPGKTALELGPLWCGNLFEEGYIGTLKHTSTSLNLSQQVKTLIDTLEIEARCKSEFCDDGDEAHVKRGNADDNADIDSTNSSRHKRPADDTNEQSAENLVKKMRTDDLDLESKIPLFYYNLHKKKISKNLPKISKLVTHLQRAGYRASRTHFEPKAVRTNATLDELKDIINKMPI